MSQARLYVGSASEVLKVLPEKSCRCCVTSPPYWGLRDYGVVGQLGLEPTPEEYVAKLVEVFREVRRVLTDDGTLWLNLGDSYNSNQARPGLSVGDTYRGSDTPTLQKAYQGRVHLRSLKPKDTVGIPWMVAFALRADGWYLRSDIIWSKPNPMPESVRDRPTKAHEYLFLLAKSERYHYDADAIAESVTGNAHPRGDGVNPKAVTPGQRIKQNTSFSAAICGLVTERNARTVWEIATKPYPEAHFATFPPELAERCIKAGSSQRGMCPRCIAAWVRVVERIGGPPQGDHRKREPLKDCKTAHPIGTVAGSALSEIYRKYGMPQNKTIGWNPTCDCGLDPTPDIVLDPFGGSGTTAAVAVGHGRDAIHIDLNPAYLELARNRIGPMLCEVKAA